MRIERSLHRPPMRAVVMRARTAAETLVVEDGEPSRPLINERTTGRGGEAEPGSEEHERGRNIARFLYWTTVVGSFLVGGVPGAILFVGGILLSKIVERADAEGRDDGTTERHETLSAAANVAHIAQYVMSVL